MERLAVRACRLPLPKLSFARPGLRPSRFFTRNMAASRANRDGERIHILGAGNLGQYLARGLVIQDPKVPVTLLFHRKGLLDDWKAAGETIECMTDGAVDRTGGIDVELLDQAGDEAETIKHLIVACKTYMTVPALKLVRSRLDEKSTIVFLQNGMGKRCSLRFSSTISI